MSKLLFLFVFSVTFYETLSFQPLEKCIIEDGEYIVNGGEQYSDFNETHVIPEDISQWNLSLILIGNSVDYLCGYVKGGNTLGGPSIHYENEVVTVGILRPWYPPVPVPVNLFYQRKQLWSPTPTDPPTTKTPTSPSLSEAQK